jgi:hypothetical protein
VLTYVVKVCLIIAIIFTYPMQLFPVTEIFDFVFLKKASENMFDIKVRVPRMCVCVCVWARALANGIGEQTG